MTDAVWILARSTGTAALVALVLAKVGLADLVIPFLVPYGRFAVGLGTISLQLVAIVLLSTWLRAKLTYGGWLAIHRLSYVAFVAAFAHGLLAGTDLAQPVIGALAWVSAAVLAIVAFRRVTAARGRQSAARSRTVAIP